MASIKFINHASVVISNGQYSVLTDPWYSGSVFNKGWDLLSVPNNEDIKKLINGIDFIWLSHEHPDHFSVPFFLKYSELIQSNGIKILFQHTKDKRVLDFLKNKKFNITEIKSGSSYNICKNFSIKIQNIDFYDSALIVEVDGETIINLNDCPFDNLKTLNQFANKYGPADILLTQFSYAAWKGGKENIKWRRKAANDKLSMIKQQANALNCKKIIPFASFIYFSNIENAYLNDSINTPQMVLNEFSKSDKDIIIMKPYELQNISEIKQSQESLNFWDKIYKDIPDLNYNSYDKKLDFNLLKTKFIEYRNKVFKKNSYLFIKVISLIPFVRVFRPVYIHLNDLKITLKVSLFKNIQQVYLNDFDVSMHSESFAFILDNEFGFDTLTVNGNFEASPSGFTKIVKSLSIGSLNAMGFRLSLSFLFKPEIYFLYLMKIFKVRKNIEIPQD